MSNNVSVFAFLRIKHTTLQSKISGKVYPLSGKSSAGFSLDLSGMGETSAGGQSVNGGGLIRGDIDFMGGPNFDRLYHKLKILLLLLILL